MNFNVSSYHSNYEVQTMQLHICAGIATEILIKDNKIYMTADLLKKMLYVVIVCLSRQYEAIYRLSEHLCKSDKAQREVMIVKAIWRTFSTNGGLNC